MDKKQHPVTRYLMKICVFSCQIIIYSKKRNFNDTWVWGTWTQLTQIIVTLFIMFWLNTQPQHSTDFTHQARLTTQLLKKKAQCLLWLCESSLKLEKITLMSSCYVKALKDDSFTQECPMKDSMSGIFIKCRLQCFWRMTYIYIWVVSASGV